MKLGRTMTLLWLASLALFAATGLAILAAPDAFDGTSGWVIRFFLGYCGIIVTAQVLAAMESIRKLIGEHRLANPLRLLLRR